MEPNHAHVYVHVIWTIRNRRPLLTAPVRKLLFADMKRAAQQQLSAILDVNGMPDHLHLLLQLHPMQALANVVRDMQTQSAQWLNESKLLSEELAWDAAYLCYSVSPSQLRQVRDYIDRQEDHHKTRSLDQELEAFLKIGQ